MEWENLVKKEIHLEISRWNLGPVKCFLEVKCMSENMNSKLVADAWVDKHITAGIYGICKLFIALP